MNLNRLGAGRKLIQSIVEQGNIKNMRWTRRQQKEAINKRPNPHTPETRDTSTKQ